jgi:hypothetical protein
MICGGGVVSVDSQSSVTCVDSVSRRIFLRSYFYRGCFSAEEEVGDIKAVPLIGRGRRVPSRADSQSASRRQNYVYEVIFCRFALLSRVWCSK